MLEETYLLANGVKIPKIGFGTWMIADNAAAATAVHEAIDAGYRHIDTAEAYGNEVGVGEGVRAAGIARQDIFVNTKLAAEIKVCLILIPPISGICWIMPRLRQWLTKC